MSRTVGHTIHRYQGEKLYRAEFIAKKEANMFCDDDYEDRPATPHDAMREHAHNVGTYYPDKAWILTDYDVYVRNPHFTGPRCELLADPEGRDEEWYIMHDGCHGDVCHAESFNVPRSVVVQVMDDLPF